jgi:galactonate dehydratase
MKITDIRTMLLLGPDPHGVGGVERSWHVLFVRVDTDAGVYGLGEAGNMMGDRQAIAYARQWLIGKDPLAINPFVRAMLSGGLPAYDPQMSPTATVDGSIVWGVSGVEMALCDLAGKILGTPVYNLLGGAFRDRVRVYLDRSGVTDPTDLQSWRDLAQRVTDEGFRDFKFDAEWVAPELNKDPWNRQMRADQVRLTYERLAAVREVAGPDAEISLDGHMSFDVETAIRLAKTLEPLNLKWFEDPVPILNFDAQKRVRDESPIPICAGEMLVPDQFREMIDRRAVDIIHPDLLFVGGLHEGKKVADYADMNAIPLAIHNNGSAMNTIAEAHLAAACPNFIGLEYHFWDAKWIGQVVRREGVATFDEDGFVPLTDAPGYGVEIDLEIARRYLAAGETLFEA